jgi:hypothetical protein
MNLSQICIASCRGSCGDCVSGYLWWQRQNMKGSSTCQKTSANIGKVIG